MPDLHKEVDPKVTINNIKQILNRIGFTKDKTTIIRNHAYNSFYSCGLIFNEYPNFKSNGKSLSETLALASAYAEFKCHICGISKNCYFGKKQQIQKNLKESYLANLADSEIKSKTKSSFLQQR